MISKITISSAWNGNAGQTGTFTLGLGPCGKTVERLELDNGDKFVIVTQVHTDGTEKGFLYPIHTLTGRIEVE